MKASRHPKPADDRIAVAGIPECLHLGHRGGAGDDGRSCGDRPRRDERPGHARLCGGQRDHPASRRAVPEHSGAHRRWAALEHPRALPQRARRTGERHPRRAVPAERGSGLLGGRLCASARQSDGGRALPLPGRPQHPRLRRRAPSGRPARALSLERAAVPLVQHALPAVGGAGGRCAG